MEGNHVAGLPELWDRDDTTKYEPGAFDLGGSFPAVVPNVNLVKGLFNSSLPAFLRRQAAYGAADSPLTFLHVDCDLYRGAVDVFHLLAHKIVPGTVIVFDDLVRPSPILAISDALLEDGSFGPAFGKSCPLGIPLAALSCDHR